MKNKLIVINVLPSNSFDDLHIKGSINVPLSMLDDYAKTLDSDQEIVVYCASYACSASKKAWNIITARGFKNVFAYEGGVAEWHQKGYPTQGPATLEVWQNIYTPHADTQIKTISAEELKEKMGQ